MEKTLIALRHMCVKEFGVEFNYEKAFRDLGSGFNEVQSTFIQDF